MTTEDAAARSVSISAWFAVTVTVVACGALTNRLVAPVVKVTTVTFASITTMGAAFVSVRVVAF